VGQIVVDANGEVVLALAGHVVEHGLHLRGGGVLGAESVAAAQYPHASVALGDDGADILVKRLAHGAGLLGAVEHRDGLNSLGQRTLEVFR